MPKNSFPGVSPRGDGYDAVPYNPATKRKKYLGHRSTPEEAYELIREWKLGGQPDRTVAGVRAAWIDLHVESDTANLVHATQRDYRNYTKRLEDHFGDEDPDKLYDEFVRVQKWAKGQSTNCVETCSAMFEWARKKRLCKSNPFEGVEGRPEKHRESKVIIRKLAELDRLAECAKTSLGGHRGEVMAALIYVQFGTILRPAHLFQLQWQDLDFVRGRIKVPAVKRGMPQEVAMLPIARKGFEILRRGAPDDYVFTNSRGTQLNKTTLGHWWPVVRAAFGEPRMVFYDLKTAGVTRLISAGVRKEHLRVQATHTDQSGETLGRHYVDMEIEEALRFVEEADAVASQLEFEQSSVDEQSHLTPVGAS